MVLVFGTILVLNLRIFGLILRSEPVAQIARDLTPVTLIGLVQVFEGAAPNFAERGYIFNMYNNGDFVPTEFETVNDER